MEKVKVAVVGCGMISPVYLRNMKELFSILDVVAVSNRTRAKAEEAAKKFGIPKVLTLDEVAANMKPRVVATSVNNLVEEYFSTHSNLDSHVEGRITVLD